MYPGPLNHLSQFELYFTINLATESFPTEKYSRCLYKMFAHEAESCNKNEDSNKYILKKDVRSTCYCAKHIYLETKIAFYL
jgi:hypothetical protein